MLRSTLSASLLWVAVAMTGCAGGNGPAEDLRTLFELLANPNVSPSRMSARVYQVLDDEARGAVDARAEALSKRLGVPVSPNDIMQIRGLSPGLRVGSITATLQEETRATLSVTFEPVRFVAGTDPAELAAQPAATSMVRTFQVVKQGGRWRVVLVDLAKLLGKVPLDVVGADRGG